MPPQFNHNAITIAPPSVAPAEFRQILPTGRQQASVDAKKHPKVPQSTFDPGPRPALGWVDVALLDVDHQYQRPLRGRHARDLAVGFCWTHFQPLTVALRPDGCYAVVDGQHRLQAALSFPEITDVPCYIVDAKDAPRQAGAFLAINTAHRAVRSVEKFRAGLLAGDETMVSLAKILEETDVQLAEGRSFKPMVCTAVSTLIMMHRHHGADVVRIALETIKAAWPEEREAFTEQFIRAICIIYTLAEPREERVIAELRKISPSDYLIERIRAGKRINRSGSAMVLEDLFRRITGREYR